MAKSRVRGGSLYLTSGDPAMSNELKKMIDTPATLAACLLMICAFFLIIYAMGYIYVPYSRYVSDIFIVTLIVWFTGIACKNYAENSKIAKASSMFMPRITMVFVLM